MHRAQPALSTADKASGHVCSITYLAEQGCFAPTRTDFNSQLSELNAVAQIVAKAIHDIMGQPPHMSPPPAPTITNTSTALTS